MTILTLRNPFKRFDIAGDKAMFDRIVKDMAVHGGSLAPSDHWNWNLGEKAADVAGYSDELYEKRYSQLGKMLNPWVGITGMKLLEPNSVTKYETFLRKIDHLKLLPDDILEHGQSNEWRETDLGSVLDISLITVFSGQPAAGRSFVCEVGGGYGRVAEIFLELYPRRVHYVMIDAVPGSLMYAYLYLKSQFPELKVGSYYAGDAYSADFDCYITPAWRTQMLPAASFDVGINIESMQEMAQQHVDFYIGLFDRLVVPGGEIYLSNARDYVFKGVWSIPPHWESLYLNNTPRSWTADHPTHVLRKGSGDYTLARAALEGAFSCQVDSWRLGQRLLESQLLLAERDRTIDELSKMTEQARQAVQVKEDSKLTIASKLRRVAGNLLRKPPNQAR